MSPRGGKRSGSGRKPLPPEERRSERLVVFVLPRERRELEALAEERGEYVGLYIRRLLSDHLARKRRGKRKP